MGVIGPDREVAAVRIEFEPKLSGLEFSPILLAEERHQHTFLQIGAIRVPVDVEPSGRDGVRTPFEDIEPVGVVGPADAHVVRHEVEDLAEAIGLQGRVHAGIGVCIAKLVVERIVVHDVVAVRAAGPRLEIGRGIEVADAKLGQVGREPGSIVEAEVGRELQAVGGAGDHAGVRQVRNCVFKSPHAEPAQGAESKHGPHWSAWPILRHARFAGCSG